MKTIYYFVVIVLHFSLQSHCIENNMCKTIQDYYTIKNNPNCEYDAAADPNADPMTIITFNGYPAETHKVTTLDGYILTIFRIPNNRMTSKKKPVFVQHGWMASAASFLGLGKNSLAFVLADAGYDVWLGNYRGSEYSEGHVNMTVFNKEYWDHSFDEIGLYDIPAQINYVSKATGNKGDIVYIGHSLGSMVGLIYSTTYPKQASKTLKLLVLLAPATYGTNMEAPMFRYLQTLYRPLLQFIMDNDLIRLTSHAQVLKLLVRQLCYETPLLLQRCLTMVNALIAGDQTQTEPKTIPVFFNQAFAGSSFRIVTQLADSIIGGPGRYNYGLRNMEKYGSDEPPPYQLKKNKVPVFLAYAINNWAVTPEDSLKLYNDLSRTVRFGKHEIKVPNFNHNDFMYGRYATSIIYNVVLQVLDGMDVG